MARALWDWSRSVNTVDMDAFDAALNICSFLTFKKKYKDLIKVIKEENNLGPEATYSSIYEFVTKNPDDDQCKQDCRQDICFLLKYREERINGHGFSATMPQEFMNVAKAVSFYYRCFKKNVPPFSGVLPNQVELLADMAEEFKILENGSEPSVMYVDPE